MRRRHRRLFALSDEIARIDETLAQARAELGVLGHLRDDAVRDAAVGGPEDREEMVRSERELARLEDVIIELSRSRVRVEEERRRQTQRLGDAD